MADLRVIGDLSGIVIAQDLADFASTAGEIELDLKWAGTALGDAYEWGDPLPASALNQLRKALDKLAALVADVEREAGR